MGTHKSSTSINNGRHRYLAVAAIAVALILVGVFAGFSSSSPPPFPNQITARQAEAHPDIIRTNNKLSVAPTNIPLLHTRTVLAQDKTYVQAYNEVLTTAQSYLQEQWCGQIGRSTSGTPTPPDPTRIGLAKIQKVWPSGSSVGPVKAIYCQLGFLMPDWYVYGQLFSPRMGGPNETGSIPVAVEMSYETTHAVYWHTFAVYFIITQMVQGKMTPISDQILAFYSVNSQSLAPEWTKRPTAVVMPPGAVINKTAMTVVKYVRR